MKCYQITGPYGGEGILLCEKALANHHRKIFERNGCVIDELIAGFGDPLSKALLEASGLRMDNHDGRSLSFDRKTQEAIFEMLDSANMDERNTFPTEFMGKFKVTRHGVHVGEWVYEFEGWLMYLGMKIDVYRSPEKNMYACTREGWMKLRPTTHCSQSTSCLNRE